jgi:hypothetical protein
MIAEFFGAFVICLCILKMAIGMFGGEGYHSILFAHVSKNSFGILVGVCTIGVFIRTALLVIPPNHQAIQKVLGAQSGEVRTEGTYITLWPIVTYEKPVSTQHISFTVAVQNRTLEQLLVMVFATGRAVPENVFPLAKLPREKLEEQLVGIAMNTLGVRICTTSLKDLRNYAYQNLSEVFLKNLKSNHFYGLDVTLAVTRVEESDQTTLKQIELLARRDGMETAIETLKKTFPDLTPSQLYAAYASLVGVDAKVMSHIVEGGEVTKNLFMGDGFNPRQ